MSAEIPPGIDLNLILAGEPPYGVPQIIGGGPSLGVTTIVIESVMMFFATLTVSLRMISSWHSRRKSTGGITLADWTSLIALMISIGQSGIVISMHKYERHQWNVSVGMLTASYFKRIYAQSFIAWIAIFLAKFSILWLYLRLFHIKRSIQYGVAIGIVWAALTYLPNMAVSSYYCAPHVGEQWDFNVGIRCGAKPALKWLVASAAMSVFLDIYIFILPIPVVLGLKLSRRKRLEVLLIFTTAFFAIVCAVFMQVYRVKLMLSTDSMWLSAQLFICNGVENYIAIIVGAMPGSSSYFKSHIQNSALFTALSSRFTSARNSSNQSSKGSTMKGAYKLRQISNDSESQRSTQYNAGQINAKHSYDVNLDRGVINEV